MGTGTHGKHIGTIKCGMGLIHCDHTCPLPPQTWQVVGDEPFAPPEPLPSVPATCEKEIRKGQEKKEFNPHGWHLTRVGMSNTRFTPAIDSSNDSSRCNCESATDLHCTCTSRSRCRPPPPKLPNILENKSSALRKLWDWWNPPCPPPNLRVNKMQSTTSHPASCDACPNWSY